MSGDLSCPQNDVPISLPPLPHKSDTTNWEFPRTTTKESYVPPKKPKSIVTREGRYEQFLWHEMYYEYVRAIERAQNVGQEPRITEYKDQFARAKSCDMDNLEQVNMINLVSKYPVYGSEAISYWNPSGRQPNQFKTKYLITKPVALQETQFG